MATNVTASPPALDVGTALQRSWGWFLALGIIEIILGTIAVGASFFATLVTVVLFGWLLLFGGVLSALHAFWRKQWKGFFLDLAMGVLYIVAGLMMVGNPAEAAVTLTLLIAMFLLVGGIFRIIVALSGHFEHWGWVLLNGLITSALGILIWRQWPLSGLWVIGLFVGIEMIMYGWTLVMLSMVARGARSGAGTTGGAGAPPGPRRPLERAANGLPPRVDNDVIHFHLEFLRCPNRSRRFLLPSRHSLPWGPISRLRGASNRRLSRPRG